MLVREQRPAAVDAFDDGGGDRASADRASAQRGHSGGADVSEGDERSPEHLDDQVRVVDRPGGTRARPLGAAAVAVLGAPASGAKKPRPLGKGVG